MLIFLILATNRRCNARAVSAFWIAQNNEGFQDVAVACESDVLRISLDSVF